MCIRDRLYSGAFYMTEWVLENRIVTVKNPYWWNADQVELEKINWIKYTDTNAKYNAFLGGEMDIIDITGEQREAFEAEGYQPSSYVGGYSYYFYCNVEDTERDISNLNLRKAISYAIDRQQFIDTVFKNDNVPSPSFAFGINGVNTETFSEVVIEANGGEPLYPCLLYTSHQNAGLDIIVAVDADVAFRIALRNVMRQIADVKILSLIHI